MRARFSGRKEDKFHSLETVAFPAELGKSYFMVTPLRCLGTTADFAVYNALWTDRSVLQNVHALCVKTYYPIYRHNHTELDVTLRCSTVSCSSFGGRQASGLSTQHLGQESLRLYLYRSPPLRVSNIPSCGVWSGAHLGRY